MMSSNLLKFCTAAIAGTIVGIAYERSHPASEWPNLFRTAMAAGSLVPRDGDSIIKKNEAIDWKAINPVSSAENLKQSAKFGLPSKDNIRIFNDYLLSYDRRLRSPIWVIEHLTPEKLKYNNSVSRSYSKFHEDESLHPFFRSSHSDFLHSGYDRGHMAAAGNHKINQDDLDQTFAYSNISPQSPNLNRGCWERLETYVRWRAKRAKNLLVVTGPLYLPMKARDGNLYVTYRVLGDNHVSVPTHYFKVFLVEVNDGGLELEAFLMPNDKALDPEAKLNEFRIPLNRLDMIERASGIIFFDQLPRKSMSAPLNLASGFKDEHSREQKKLSN